ncbi:hypothetical protein Tco_0167160 [Tanacetum coccineum]
MFSMIVKNIEKDVMTHERMALEFEEGEECGFDSREDEVVPKVEDVSLVDGVFDGAFGGDGDEDFSIGEGFDLLSGLDDEACVEAMEVEEEEEKCGEDDEENEEDDYLIKMRWMNLEKHGYSE